MNAPNSAQLQPIAFQTLGKAEGGQIPNSLLHILGLPTELTPVSQAVVFANAVFEQWQQSREHSRAAGQGTGQAVSGPLEEVAQSLMERWPDSDSLCLRLIDDHEKSPGHGVIAQCAVHSLQAAMHGLMTKYQQSAATQAPWLLAFPAPGRLVLLAEAICGDGEYYSDRIISVRALAITEEHGIQDPKALTAATSQYWFARQQLQAGDLLTLRRPLNRSYVTNHGFSLERGVEMARLALQTSQQHDHPTRLLFQLHFDDSDADSAASAKIAGRFDVGSHDGSDHTTLVCCGAWLGDQALPVAPEAQNHSLAAMAPGAGDLELIDSEQRPQSISSGRGVGFAMASGAVRHCVKAKDIVAGDVVVASQIDPSWLVPLQQAAAVITERGGRTSHAAIMAVEHGIPAVVSASHVDQLQDGQLVTVVSEGNMGGFVYQGDQQAALIQSAAKIPQSASQSASQGTSPGTSPSSSQMQQNPLPAAKPGMSPRLMMSVGNPDRAFSLNRFEHQGIGLARLEFLLGRSIGIHPQAVLQPERLPLSERQRQYEMLGLSWGEDNDADMVDIFVRRMAEGIATLAVAVAPHQVLIRLSDFKSDEYRGLLGGDVFEPIEPNPALGLRGAARYLHHDFRTCMEQIETRAICMARDEMHCANLSLVVPFVRTLQEAEATLQFLQSCGIERSASFQILLMAELPSNVLQAQELLQIFDGFCIGTNDLTQLMLGADRSSASVAHLHDESSPVLKRAYSALIDSCHNNDAIVNVCGRCVGEDPQMALWFAQQGVSALTVDPRSMPLVRSALAGNL